MLSGNLFSIKEDSVTIQFEPTVMDKAAQECWFKCLTKYLEDKTTSKERSTGNSNEATSYCSDFSALKDLPVHLYFSNMVFSVPVISWLCELLSICTDTLEHYECYFGVMPRASESNNQEENEDEDMNQNENNDKEEWKTQTRLQMIHKMYDKLIACKKLEGYNIMFTEDNEVWQEDMYHYLNWKRMNVSKDITYLKSLKKIIIDLTITTVTATATIITDSNQEERAIWTDQLWEYFEGRIEKWEDIEIRLPTSMTAITDKTKEILNNIGMFLKQKITNASPIWRLHKLALYSTNPDVSERYIRDLLLETILSNRSAFHLHTIVVFTPHSHQLFIDIVQAISQSKMLHEHLESLTLVSNPKLLNSPMSTRTHDLERVLWDNWTSLVTNCKNLNSLMMETNYGCDSTSFPKFLTTLSKHPIEWEYLDLRLPSNNDIFKYLPILYANHVTRKTGLLIRHLSIAFQGSFRSVNFQTQIVPLLYHFFICCDHNRHYVQNTTNAILFAINSSLHNQFIIPIDIAQLIVSYCLGNLIKSNGSDCFDSRNVMLMLKEVFLAQSSDRIDIQSKVSSYHKGFEKQSQQNKVKTFRKILLQVD
ncbi:hypothetical protein RFI_03126 [Reticulomyxa filosa]|uniref:Uncharacterized protein n=1 Tax=Reticulomyxa filosa TaxID=46433 RepID=X6P629_RETFI|nr:hypothetical protein RFI_03126 [Reticulomyxa filosa]|eukprot:ETO33970.1 hypothetical protein RFI_03126 [Reticulomyxa filosa]